MEIDHASPASHASHARRADREAQLARVGMLAVDAEVRHFTAGALTVEFEGGALRYLRYRGQELVRAISFLVRDENWGTFPATITGLQAEENDAGFTLRFQSQCGAHGDDLSMQASIVGSADGSLDFEVTATVRRSFSTNRTGFVVLHPLEVSGLPVAVEHVDGRIVQARYPEQINPLQPFMDIRALTTQHADGLQAQVRMEGDTFEMEDQRNWSDASFKTYVRPLALPWPYRLEQGDTLRQAVRVRAQASAVAAASAAATAQRYHPAEVTLDAASRTGVMPRLGIGVRAADLADSLAQAAQLKALGVAFFVAHLDVRRDALAASLDGFARLSELAETDYVLEVVLDNDPSPQAVQTQLGAIATIVTGLARAPVALQCSAAADLKAVLPGSPWPTAPSFASMLDTARAQFPGMAVGAGSFAYFTELNRKRPPAKLLDYLSFTTCPIVHAADDRSVMETLSTLPYIARSAQALYPGMPYRVGPSSIAARDNPYGSSTAPNRHDEQAQRLCLTDDDARQRGLFGAAWNLAYFSQFACHGAGHIALSELNGPRGVIDDGRPTPLYHLLASLAQARQASLLFPVVAADSNQRKPYVLALRDHDAWRVWLANPTADTLAVDLALPATRGSLRRWDSQSVQGGPVWTDFSGRQLQLQAYETVQLTLPAGSEQA